MTTLANIKVEPMTVLLDGTDLGCTDGDISISYTEDAVDITCHQHGTQVMDRIRTGYALEVSVTLKEVSTAQLKALLNYAGQSYTPSLGTPVAAWGLDKQFSSKLADAKKLVLKPVGAGDDLRNHTFFKAYPNVGTITFSGENPQTVEVTFECYPDSANVAEANLYVYGDGTQDFT